MKLEKLIHFDLSENEKKVFKEHTINQNIIRGKLFSKMAISIETVLLVTLIFCYGLSVSEEFEYFNYAIMYILMIIISLIFLLKLHKIEKLFSEKLISSDKVEFIIMAYITFFMTWGAVITLFDQDMYGQVMAYIMNIIICSIIFYVDNKKMIFSYGISILILSIGLLFVQESRDILIGHYFNLVIFLILSWLISRILYFDFYRDFSSKNLLKSSNERLLREINEKNQIQKELECVNEKLRILSSTDELTKIPNRRKLKYFIEDAWNYCSEGNRYISIIMIDIDYFKLYNDNYGHAAGDNVLVLVAKELESVVRFEKDFIARYGGEEFIYVALDTDENEIMNIAETLRQKIQNLKIPHEYSKGDNSITISLGTATKKLFEKDDITKCIVDADKSLYKAKNQGRNCVS